ncbi:CarD family transcriptional regulator [Methylocystis sp.]|uniref:CarD family transcriptional regulator n=1 Tax=Methylocystis sp. TaxID=1911079 RepID=UPI002733D2B5|nr:CarD family transcriptional regulator [Methylocystis sp.]MDP3552493.1 CarD family transcriptional regulator [Methylocystis sp.]
MTAKTTTTKSKSAAKDKTAKTPARATATRRTATSARSVARASAAKPAAKSSAKTAVEGKTAVAGKSATKRAVAAKAAKTAVEKVSASAKTPAANPVTPKTAAAKPAEATPAAAAKQPAARPVEQKPAAPVAPAAAKPRPLVEAEPKSVVETVAPLATTQETSAAPGIGARPGIPAKPKPAAPSAKPGFKLSEYIVYPAHGVGQIVGVETQEVAGFSLELFVVSFIKDKMTLKVPTSKVVSVGMRKLADTAVVDRALQTLSGRARVKRTMWSRRAQEYEAKINSGDLITIAEVVRDLYRSDTQPEQSYSERQLYEAALDRMAREVAAVRKLIDSESLKLIESFLLKGPRRGPKAEGDAGDDGGDEADVDRAA